MCSVKKVALKKFVNFIGKPMCWSLFLIKLQAFGPHWCFPVKSVNFLRTPILKKICERLLPYFHYNSHSHYQHHHFHYHCKMRLYHLRIPLFIRILAKFCLLSSSIYFSLQLFQVFRFLRPVKGLRIRL